MAKRKKQGESIGEPVAGPVTKAPPKQAPARTPPKQLPRYKVLLHNDDVNEIGYVVEVVRKLTALSREEAALRTLEAHETGVALLLVTHKERAELYVEQFAACRLTVTIEPES